MSNLTQEQKDQLERLSKLPVMTSPYFTVVFEGDLSTIQGNPFHIESVWGKPVTIGRGDMLAQIESLCESIEANQERD
jgi:hypothetical protein